MRTYNRVENRIKNLIINEFKLVRRYLSPETNLKEDLGLDEYDMIFLSLALENEFQVILEQQVHNTFSIKDTAHYVIQNLLKARRAKKHNANNLQPS